MGRPQRESNEITKTLSDKLSDLMEEEKKRTGLKQEEICRKIGVASSSYSDWASDQKTPNVDKVALIANYFDASVDWLLGLSPTRSRDPNVQNAVLYTGLSEDATNALHSLLGNSKKNHDFCSVVHGFINTLMKQKLDVFKKYTIRTILSRTQAETKSDNEFGSLAGLNFDEYEERKKQLIEKSLEEDREIDLSISSGSLVSVSLDVAASLFEDRAKAFLGAVLDDYIVLMIQENHTKHSDQK